MFFSIGYLCCWLFNFIQRYFMRYEQTAPTRIGYVQIIYHAVAIYSSGSGTGQGVALTPGTMRPPIRRMETAHGSQ